MRVRIAAALCTAMLVTAGCERARETGAIVAIPRDTAGAYWVCLRAGVSHAAQKYAVPVYWNGPSDTDDVDQQLMLMSRAIKAGARGIVVSPNNSFALKTEIQRASAHNIPVVIATAPIAIDADSHISFVLTDQAAGAKMVAQRLLKLFPQGGDVVLLGTNPLSPGIKERADAAQAALGRVAPQLHPISVAEGPHSSGQAEIAAEELLRTHNNVRAIYALSVVATRGAVAAVRAMHMEDKVIIIGCDQTLDVLFALRQGIVDSIVVQDMRTIGEQAVENIMATRDGRAVQQVRYVQPMLMTRANIDEPQNQLMLRMDWRPAP